MKLVFDFDGTIADTMPALGKLAKHVCFKHDLELYPGDYERTAGRPFGGQLKMLFPETRFDLRRSEAAAEYEEKHLSISMACDPFPDLYEAIRICRAAGDKLGLASATDIHILKAWLEKHELSDHFILPRRGYTKLGQVARHGADIFIGDTNRDAEIAHEIGTLFVGIRRDPKLIVAESGQFPVHSSLKEWLV